MKKLKNFVRVLFAVILALTLTNTQTVEAASDTVVIYEVYGGGGNSGATFKNDYIILKNISTENQKLDGLYVHRGSAKAWQDKIALTGNLKPGQYYLIEAQEGSNKDAKALPRTGDVKAPDMGIGAKNFSIALTRSADAPSSTNTIDLLGAGTAKLNEGSSSKAGANNVSIRRIIDKDTDNNANDFEAISLEETSLDYFNNDESSTEPENSGDKEQPSTPEIDPSNSLVIYEIFKGGARDGSIYKNDYIVVKNISSEPVSLKGKRLQAYKWYSSGYKWGSVYRFPNQSLEPGDYFVITGNQGFGKTSQNLEVPNGNHSLLMWNQKDYALAITNDGEDPTLENTIDIVGDEKSGKYEGEPAPTLSNNYSIRRVEGKDTNNNKNDFTVINHDDYKESEKKPLDYLNKKEDTKEINFKVDDTKGTVEGETTITVNVDATEDEILKNAPIVTGNNGYTFIKWNKTSEDTYTAEFEAPHGKVEVHFITGTYINEKFENRKSYTQLTGDQLNGAGFQVVNQSNQDVTEAKRYVKSGKDVLAVGPQLGTGLGRGDYKINITPPEGYEISAIKRYAKTDAETIENGSIVTLPIKESPDRITNPEVLYVELVEKTLEVENATVTFAFNKAIDGVDIPEAQKVEAGTEITLPEVSPEVKDGYSFLGWVIGDNKNATANLKPGDKITVEEDTNVMGIWEGAYGKVSLTFHTGEFKDNSNENRNKITKLEDEQLVGGGFNVENQQSRQVTKGKKSSSKGKISINNGLVKGTYTLNVTAPEGYEIVRIARDTGSNGVIEIENGSTISLPRPEAPFNLTMADSIYVEVKEKEEEKATVTFAFNKAIDGVDIPEAQKVEVGTEITLPEVSPEVKDGNSFLGWIVNGGKYSTPNLKPGDAITVDKDTTIMGIWEGAYGKVSLTFHTGEFIDNSHENRDKITKLEDEQLVGGGFNVENQQSGQVTEGKKSSSKGKISINNGLVKGTYTLNVTAPEGYEIVRIARDTGSNGVIEIENNSTISLPRPEAPFNLTMVDSIYVEVKEKEEEKATVTFEFDQNIDGAKLPDPITVPVGTEIELPKLDEEVLGDYSFMGWELDKSYPNKADANPGDTIKVTEDMTVKGYWEGRYGRFAVHFHEGDYFENKDNLKTLTEGFGFATINPRDKTRLEGVLAGENSKNPYFITPNKAQGGGLTKDAYDLEFTIPEGYKIVSIDKKLADGGLEQVNTGERISPYWYPFNLTMVRGVYVQVEKEEPKIELPQGLYIYEIYGGGGLQQSYYANDYVVLQNTSDTNINLAGINLHVSNQWRPEYAYNIPLSGTIKANGYFVIKAGAGFKKGAQKELPRVDLDISGGKLYKNDFDYQGIGLALTMGPEDPNEKNTIDKVGTYYNNQYLVKPATSPHVDSSIRRVAYEDINKTDFEKVSHRPYVEGTADHREPLWYLSNKQEEKVTVTFAHNVELTKNETPAEQNVWSGTKITLPQVKEEEKFEFKGWDVDVDGIADKEAGEEFEVKENVKITGIWEEIKPEVKTINFVVDPEKGSATGALFAEVIEGEDPLAKAPKVEAKEGYKFVEWKTSEDGLTYTAVFEEEKVDQPVELIRDNSIKFEVLEPFEGDTGVLVTTSQAGDLVVIEVNGNEVLRKASNQANVEEWYEINQAVKKNDKVSVYIVRNNQFKSSIINKRVVE